MFRLTKWYLDVVTDAGSTLVGYLARLRWGPMRVQWGSVLLCPPGQPCTETVTVSRPGRLHHEEGSLHWRAPRLRLDGRWIGNSPPIHQVLWQEPRGTIEWTGLQPRAIASVTVGETRLEGIGYAERLSLTLRPWQLPFDRLWWGRYTSSRHAVTWIVWDGPTRRQWIWRDGTLQPEARLVEDGVAELGGGYALRLRFQRDIQRRDAVAAIVGHLPVLRTRLADRFPALQEHKRLSAAELIRGHAVVDRGWVIDEEVRR